MMKKKLASALVVLTGVIALSSTSAQARGHHQRGVHAARHGAHKHHSGALAYRRAGRAGRHASQSGRPAAWCGWWLGQHLGISNRNLWLARNWASVGTNAGRPEVGVVVVWRHHVGIITGREGSGWVIKSGNDGHTVRERVRSIAGAIAFRRLGAGAGFSS